MKLSPKQRRVLSLIAERNGFYDPWSVGTSTAEALRRRGLVEGERPFTRWSNSRFLRITNAGRAALSEDQP